MALAIRLTRTFVLDMLGAAFHLAHAGWLVPSKLQHVWAFQGKSLPAVKSMSAPVTGTNSQRERKRRTFARGALYLPHGWSPFRFVRLCPHLPVGIVLAPYRRAGGNGSRIASGEAT